jgi:hypothetical protein
MQETYGDERAKHIAHHRPHTDTLQRHYSNLVQTLDVVSTAAGSSQRKIKRVNQFESPALFRFVLVANSCFVTDGRLRPSTSFHPPPRLTVEAALLASERLRDLFKQRAVLYHALQSQSNDWVEEMVCAFTQHFPRLTCWGKKIFDQDLIDELDDMTPTGDNPLVFLYKAIQRRYASELTRVRNEHETEKRLEHANAAEKPSVDLLRARAEAAERPVDVDNLVRQLRAVHSGFLGLGDSGGQSLDEGEDFYTRVTISQGMSNLTPKDMLRERLTMLRQVYGF